MLVILNLNFVVSSRWYFGGGTAIGEVFFDLKVRNEDFTV